MGKYKVGTVFKHIESGLGGAIIQDRKFPDDISIVWEGSSITVLRYDEGAIDNYLESQKLEIIK
jgi:hypothetical protein